MTTEVQTEFPKVIAVARIKVFRVRQTNIATFEVQQGIPQPGEKNEESLKWQTIALSHYKDASEAIEVMHLAQKQYIESMEASAKAFQAAKRLC